MIRIEGIPILASRLEQADQRTKRTLSGMMDYGAVGFNLINEWAVLPPEERVSIRSSDEVPLRNGPVSNTIGTTMSTRVA